MTHIYASKYNSDYITQTHFLPNFVLKCICSTPWKNNEIQQQVKEQVICAVCIQWNIIQPEKGKRSDPCYDLDETQEQ